MTSKKKNFANAKALVPVENVILEAETAVKDSKRTIATSSIPEVLGGVAGAGTGAAGSFAALYFLGVTGLSASGITSALAAAGAIVGGGMVAGIGVLAAPVAVGAVAGYGILVNRRNKKLAQLKAEMLKRAISARDAILKEMKKKNAKNEERLNYLTSLNILLQRGIQDLQDDLAK